MVPKFFALLPWENIFIFYSSILDYIYFLKIILSNSLDNMISLKMWILGQKILIYLENQAFDFEEIKFVKGLQNTILRSFWK
jgi:hypothetical protein